MFDFFFKKKFFAPKLFKKTKKSFLTILRKNSFFTKSSAFSHHPGDKKTQNPTQLTLKNDKVDVSGQYVPLQPPAQLIFACSNQPNSVFTPFSPPNSRLAVKISVLSHETYAGSSSPHHPCGSQVNFTKRKIFFLILLVVAMQQKVVAQIRRESVDWYVELGRPEGAAVVRPRPARRSHVHEPSPDRNRAPSPMPRAAAAQSMPPLRPFVRRPSTLALPPQPQQRAVAVSSAATRDRFWARRPPIAVVPAPVKRMHLW